VSLNYVNTTTTMTILCQFLQQCHRASVWFLLLLLLFGRVVCFVFWDGVSLLAQVDLRLTIPLPLPPDAGVAACPLYPSITGCSEYCQQCRRNMWTPGQYHCYIRGQRSVCTGALTERCDHDHQHIIMCTQYQHSEVMCATATVLSKFCT
jgi:hypothetical protein